jgi:DNA invertase Pin-like site-specific DNA recombinase
MLTGYSYIRFSSAKQATGASLTRQLEATQAYCTANHIHLDQSLTLHDLGVSASAGKNLTSGALGSFLQLCESDQIIKPSCLIIENFDRLSRMPVADHLDLFLDILKHVDIVTLTDGKRYSRKDLNMTDLIISIAMMSRAFEENETKRLRVADAKARARANLSTKKMTAQGPHWLKLSQDRSKWDVIPDRVKIIKLMFKMYLDGNGFYKLTTYLNANDIKAPKGGFWTVRSVQKIMNSKTVIGHFQPTSKGKPIGDLVENYYTPIISEQDYYSVQSLRSQRSTGSAGPTGVNFTNLFKGLAKCHCGAPMHYVTKSAKAIYLVCRNARDGRSCKYRGYRYKETESFLLKLLACIDYSKMNGDNSTILQSKLGKLQESITNAKQRRDNFSEAIGADTSGSLISLIPLLAEAEAALTDLHSQREAIQAELTSNTNRCATTAFNTLSTTDGTDRARLNIFLKQHIDRLVFDNDQVQVHFHSRSFVATANLSDPVTPETMTGLYDDQRLADLPLIFEADEKIVIW